MFSVLESVVVSSDSLTTSQSYFKEKIPVIQFIHILLGYVERSSWSNWHAGQKDRNHGHLNVFCVSLRQTAFSSVETQGTVPDCGRGTFVSLAPLHRLRKTAGKGYKYI